MVVNSERGLMGNSAIPRAQGLALVWMKQFSGGIAANPAMYQLTPADAANLQNVVQTFEDALRVATAPSTRTSSAVMAKDYARNLAEQLCQSYYSLIKINAGITDADKVAIGVRPVNRTRTKINCPATSPVVNILGCTPGVQTLMFRDSIQDTQRGKPFGATFLELVVAVGDQINNPLDAARPAGLHTRSPISVTFDQVDVGKRATYYARWVSRRGETGPWSLPTSMSVAA